MSIVGPAEELARAELAWRHEQANRARLVASLRTPPKPVARAGAGVVLALRALSGLAGRLADRLEITWSAERQSVALE
jgi:hypothetical protein